MLVGRFQKYQHKRKERFIKFWSLEDEDNWIRKPFSVKITGRWKKTMTWLLY